VKGTRGVCWGPLDQPQPIREHEVANLALEFLGYTSVPGSSYNFQQDLTYG
jgi:hypothetical protein